MNRNRAYEVQCLMELLGTGINNEPIPTWHREPDWRALYKTADYHHVANTLYNLILGMDSRHLAKWKSSFEERYHYCVIMQERYSVVEEEILDTLEDAKIHTMELEEMAIRGCYERVEQHYPFALSYLIEPGKGVELREAMDKIDFESIDINPNNEMESKEGEFWFKRVGGMTIVFYERLSFVTKKNRKYFSLPPQPFKKKNNYKFIHKQDTDDFYIYYISWIAEKFAHGSLEIRDMVDLWKYYQKYYERMDWKSIYDDLKQLELDRFSDLIVELAAMWFSRIDDFEEAFDSDLELLLYMEKYIISKGTEARDENAAILPLVKEVADVYARDLKREKRKKLMSMWFPERSYMESIYPFLAEKKFLLPLCWVRRLVNKHTRKVRFVFQSMRMTVKGIFAGLAAKVKSIGNAIKSKTVIPMGNALRGIQKSYYRSGIYELYRRAIEKNRKN